MDDPTPFIPPETWCPKCLADAPDAFGTFLAYCSMHQPSIKGADDPPESHWFSVGDADATNCRAIQDLIT